MSLIGLLVALLVIVVVIYIVRLLLPMLGLPEPINTVVLLVIGLAGLLWLLSAVGVLGPSSGFRLRP